MRKTRASQIATYNILRQQQSANAYAINRLLTLGLFTLLASVNSHLLTPYKQQILNGLKSTENYPDELKPLFYVALVYFLYCLFHQTWAELSYLVSEKLFVQGFVFGIKQQRQSAITLSDKQLETEITNTNKILKAQQPFVNRIYYLALAISLTPVFYRLFLVGGQVSIMGSQLGPWLGAPELTGNAWIDDAYGFFGRMQGLIFLTFMVRGYVSCCKTRHLKAFQKQLNTAIPAEHKSTIRWSMDKSTQTKTRDAQVYQLTCSKKPSKRFLKLFAKTLTAHGIPVLHISDANLWVSYGHRFTLRGIASTSQKNINADLKQRQPYLETQAQLQLTLPQELRQLNWQLLEDGDTVFYQLNFLGYAVAIKDPYKTALQTHCPNARTSADSITLLHAELPAAINAQAIQASYLDILSSQTTGIAPAPTAAPTTSRRRQVKGTAPAPQAETAAAPIQTGPDAQIQLAGGRTAYLMRANHLPAGRFLYAVLAQQELLRNHALTRANLTAWQAVFTNGQIGKHGSCIKPCKTDSNNPFHYKAKLADSTVRIGGNRTRQTIDVQGGQATLVEFTTPYQGH